MSISESRGAIPYLIIESVDDCITFLEKVFDAKLSGKLTRPNNSIMHAEVKLGRSTIMLGEPMGEFAAMPASLFVYVEDVDVCYLRALEIGAKSVMEVTDFSHAGVRYGGVVDINGNLWWIAQQKEEVSWAEQQLRIDNMPQLWSDE